MESEEAVKSGGRVRDKLQNNVSEERYGKHTKERWIV